MPHCKVTLWVPVLVQNRESGFQPARSGGIQVPLPRGLHSCHKTGVSGTTTPGTTAQA
jgi:hypothetical protein